jgi:hypothetical protein
MHGTIPLGSVNHEKYARINLILTWSQYKLYGLAAAFCISVFLTEFAEKYIEVIKN